MTPVIYSTTPRACHSASPPHEVPERLDELDLRAPGEKLQARMRGFWAQLQLLHVLAAIDRDIGPGHERRLVRA